MRTEWLAKRMFRSGQQVPLDGEYGDLWGTRLALFKGDLFPFHPQMGDSRWSYRGPFGMGMPAWKGPGGAGRLTGDR
ncbi:hypothetical protein SAMN02799624_04653 [Paenibacillus sp. UNC496MF]|uniref:hypothetical protein n=1 Tax=Paenibacillus sp. UNC496MF TaxID=1502753 RepID=UPI0008E3B61B|nr:hypothetical protein [Paenibacillus sp. UNC496MF]SFJ48116.1 hypothetical protein SAMN02799624_04653 [Paenibacillus sp. UNC496MF]